MECTCPSRGPTRTADLVVGRTIPAIIGITRNVNEQQASKQYHSSRQLYSLSPRGVKYEKWRCLCSRTSRISPYANWSKFRVANMRGPIRSRPINHSGINIHSTVTQQWHIQTRIRRHNQTTVTNETVEVRSYFISPKPITSSQWMTRNRHGLTWNVVRHRPNFGFVGTGLKK